VVEANDVNPWWDDEADEARRHHRRLGARPIDGCIPARIERGLQEDDRAPVRAHARLELAVLRSSALREHLAGRARRWTRSRERRRWRGAAAERHSGVRAA